MDNIREKELREMHTILTTAWKDIIQVYSKSEMTDDDWHKLVAKIEGNMEEKRENENLYKFTRELGNLTLSVAERLHTKS